jgi:hypothetical protein
MNKTTSGQPPVQKPSKGKYEQWLTEDGLTRLQAWARDGLTDAQIAHNCGVNVKTLWDWKKKHYPICSALKEGKEVVDLQVENALLKRALGYEYTETTIEESDKNGTTIRTFQKHMAPDVTAQIYWLKNRKRDVWKDSHDRAEIERERLELDKEKAASEIKEKQSGPATIQLILSPELEEFSV